MFYFDMKTSKGTLKDYEGEDHPNLAAAIAEADRATRELVADRLLSGRDFADEEMVIHDGSETPLVTIRLVDVPFKWRE